MEIELKEIRDFIASIPPFDELPNDIVESLTQQILIRYIRRGTPLPPDNIQQQRLYLLRKGAISLLSEDDKLLGKLSEGDICTAFCMERNIENFKIQVDEDTLVYTIPCDVMVGIVGHYPGVLSFIQENNSHRLKMKVSAMKEAAALSSSLMHTPLSDLLHFPVINLPSHASIRDAALKMAEHGVSSVLIMRDDKPVGIVTDKDISKRCVAADICSSAEVDQIMTCDMVSANTSTSAFEALMIMTRKHIHHLPVINNNELKGIISITDLMRLEGQNSIYLTSAIHKARNIEALIEHSRVIPLLQVKLVKMGATPEHVGKGVTAVTTAITKRLIVFAEEKLGPAPVAYGWLGAGSHARREQTSHSDQDNALIISDELQEKDKPWFAALAKFVSDGLAQCGYVYCPGNVMASNPKWRQTQSVWSEYFHQWVGTPSPKALMYSSIFFDLRTIHGDETLLKQVRAKMLEDTQQSSIFQANLTINAMKLRPPLGFFRGFVLVHDGKHNDTLDLKHNGIAPIVDLARIYALAEGITSVGTRTRLKKAAGTASLSKDGAANLLDAFEFINTLKIQHQAKQIQENLDPDNYMSPVEISKLEREHLKNVFKVIQTMQASLEARFNLG
ncbi:MAG: putative nucleotidyltransferase substrate binding domain-containing protein [Pseudomonadota bacterium]